jgi:hypothetical protein
MSILELAMFLKMDLARTFAIQALGAPNMDLSPARQISLTLSYHITEWIEPAFRQLVATPANRVTANDFSLLGSQLTHLVISTQADIHALCLPIAFNLLKLTRHDTSCQKPYMGCQCSWEAAWWDRLAHHYLHPDCPASPREAISKLESTPIVGVTTTCRLAAVEIIKEQRVFEREDDMLENALKALKSYEGIVVGA